MIIFSCLGRHCLYTSVSVIGLMFEVPHIGIDLSII